MPSPLDLKDIHRAYIRGEEVIHGVDLRLESSEVVGLLGRNGAGKTTLIRVAMGLIRPQRGQVQLFGLDYDSSAMEIKKHVGYVSQEQTLPAFMEVADIIELHRSLYPRWDDKLQARLIERFGLSPKQKIASLSMGQSRQAALLCAVCHRPDLLLLDEPAGSLDPSARREFLEVAIEVLQESGTAILFSSHHTTDIERIASRVAIIEGGRKIVDRELDDLKENTCLVVVGANEGVDEESITKLDGCLSARKHSGQLRAIIDKSPDQTRALLRAELSTESIHCAPAGLEELFIEMVRGQR